MPLTGGFAMRPRFPLLASLFISSLITVAAVAQQQAPLTSPEERAALHNSSDWAVIAPHLPDPAKASAHELETAADVLRARRFPEDALDYYGYAMARGGNVSEILNKMGIVRLELRQIDLARAMFLRTVRADKRNAEAWNNLGVSDYVNGNYKMAISEYRHAAKLKNGSAVFHSNLGLAYFEAKDPESARKQFEVAVRLDPSILQQRGGGGTTMHVIGSTNYPSLCFEMARVYAHQNDLATMREWLGKASEGGFDVREAMKQDPVLKAYVKDPELVMLLANADQLRKRNVAATGKAPGLGTDPQPD
jgi:tetratricopeptide (TPR) repeat protein